MRREVYSRQNHIPICWDWPKSSPYGPALEGSVDLNTLRSISEGLEGGAPRARGG